jgi:hypothetical protein
VAPPGSSWILTPREIGESDGNQVGGKALALVRMMRAGFRVPSPNNPTQAIIEAVRENALFVLQSRPIITLTGEHGFLWSHMDWLTSLQNFPTRLNLLKDWAHQMAKTIPFHLQPGLHQFLHNSRVRPLYQFGFFHLLASLQVLVAYG